MKFSQLAEGQQFEYQGVVYTRKGPLMAVDNDGRSKMIPRSAEVRVLDGVQESVKLDLQASITLEQAVNAFNTFVKQFDTCVENAMQDGMLASPDIKQCMKVASEIFNTEIQSD